MNLLTITSTAIFFLPVSSSSIVATRASVFPSSSSIVATRASVFPSSSYKFTSSAGLRRCVNKEKEEVLLEGMPSHYYDDEWQAQQREKTKELHRRRREEEEEEERKIEEYGEVGMRLKGYPEEDVRKARILVSSFIRAVDEVEEVVKWRCPKQTLPPNNEPGFQKKALYLESIGIDPFSLIEKHPMLITASLSDIKSTVEYITAMNFSAIEFRRMVGMCPGILTTKVSDIIPVFMFLNREVRVSSSNIKHVINRRPRLIMCNVDKQLRPTMYFLQSIGIEEVNKHTDLLSCNVEDKFIPRIEYFENIGFSRRDVTSMFRRFPQLFCYSIKNNFEPKYNYFVVEMGRDLKEVKEFPQYFSFSLENRIKPRHKRCVEMGVCFPLPLLLKTSEVKFQNRLDAFVNSSTPLKTSPLWCAGRDIVQV